MASAAEKRVAELEAAIEDLQRETEAALAEADAELERERGRVAMLDRLAQRLAPPDTRTLDERMVAVQLELEDVPRAGHAEVTTKSGGTYTYDYITEADLMKGIRPLLAQNGIATYYHDEILRYDGGTATVRVYLTFAANGEQRELSAEGYAADMGDKAANKAKTNAVRYLLWKTFLQPSDEDDPEQKSTSVEDAAKADDARRRAAELRAGERTRRTDRATQDTRPKLIERLATLSIELDEVQGLPAGRTLGLLDDMIQAEHGTSKAELAVDELVKIGQALAHHVEQERGESERQALDYTPTEFTLPR